ncbi:MAG: LTA synthase family protein [Eubacteriales bacterium]
MENFKKLACKYSSNEIVIFFVFAFFVNFIIESISRHSVIACFTAYLIKTPLVFLLNTIIIFATISISLLFKRRAFFTGIIIAVWLILGITNGIILANRMTPFTTKDLAVAGDGLSLISAYLSPIQMGLLAVGICILLAVVIISFIFAPKVKSPINYKRAISVFLVILITTFGSTELAVRTKVVNTFFGNLWYAYRDYGVPYCFINTWLNTGIKPPLGYSEEKVQSVFSDVKLEKYDYKKPDNIVTVKDKPNVIFLQLESFVDPTLVRGMEYSKDPIPNFRELLKKNSSGFLTVPAVGGGTANTEFETLTGMSVKFFGPGEYPYKSILKETTCESIAYNLKSVGYGAHAIHNHRGAFYSRNKVFKNLGFDTFTSIEYMNDVEKTPKNWAKDDILVGQMFDALKSTDGSDFIYTCSVQGHGKYPVEKILMNPEIKVTRYVNEETRWAYEYYVNQIYEMDKFIKHFTDELKKFDEKTVVVMYGDHLPAIDITQDEYKGPSVFDTQYVIWANYDIPTEKKNLMAWELSANILQRLGMNMGVMPQFHIAYDGTPDYEKNMKLLEYDMLYGKHYIFGGENPYEPTQMRMGVKPIKVKEIVTIGDKRYIKGENFTEYSKISIDGKILKTIFLGSSILGLQENVDETLISKMKVSQVEKQKEILSTTE